MSDTLNRHVQNLLAGGLILLVLGFFISPTPGTHEQIFMYFVIIPFVLTLLVSPGKNYGFAVHDPLFWMLSALLVFLAATSLWAPDFTPDILFYFAKRIFYILALFLATKLIINRFPGYERLLVHLIVFSASLVAVGVLFHYLGEHGFTLVRLFPEKGSFLTLGRYNNPIRAGWIWGASSLCCFWLILTPRSSRSFRVFIWPLLLLPQLALLLVTLSRGPLLAFVLTLPLMILLTSRKIFEKKNIVIFFLLAVSAIALLFGTDIFEKLLDDPIRARGLDYRLALWQQSLEMTRNDVWFGLGYSRDAPLTIAPGISYPHSHNFILDVFRFAGVAGVLLLLAHHLYWLFISLKEKEEIRLWGLIFLYGCLCLLTNGKYVLANLSEFWFIYWLPISIIYALHWQHGRPATPVQRP